MVTSVSQIVKWLEVIWDLVEKKEGEKREARGERLKIGRMGIPEDCVLRTLFCHKSEAL